MSKFFINRPIVAIVIAILTVIVGAVALVSLPIAQFPKIVPPEARITTTFVGADAQTVEQSVATPIEQVLSGVDNLNYMYSINASDGSLRLTANFDVATDPNTDLILTQMRVTQAGPQLPADVANFGVTVQKQLTAPLMLVALYSPTDSYNSTFLANYAYINVIDQLTRVPGIANATVFGAGQYAMRYWVKPDQLAKLNITVDDVIRAVQSQNTVNPAGQVGGEPAPKGQEFTYSVRAQGRLTSPEEFGAVIIRANPDGSTVRLRDVARVELGAQVYNLMGRLNGNPAAVIAIYQLPGSNALDCANGAKQAMARLKARFPHGLDYQVSLDTTQSVSEGMREISNTLWQAMLLVILVVFVFLQGWRPTLIPMLAVPVSLVGTFILFPAFGFSVNTLSLFGLVLAIGLVVDDAIVVVEAVEHHIEEGMAPRDATIRAMEEVSGPVVAIAIILAAVFIPTAFIPGITAASTSSSPLTIAISVIISAFNALSLSPALCAMLLRPKDEASGPLNRFYGWFNATFLRVQTGYVGVLPAPHPEERPQLLRPRVLCGAGVPPQPEAARLVPSRGGPGLHLRRLQLPNASSLQRTSQAAVKVEDILKATPGVKTVTSVIGFSPAEHGHQHLQRLLLRQLQALVGAHEARGEVRCHQGPHQRRAAQDPRGEGDRLLAPVDSRHRHGGRLHVRARGPRRTRHLVPLREREQVHGGRGKRKEIAGLSTTFLPSVPQIFVNVDRAKVLKQGVALADVYRTLQCYMGGIFVNYFNRFGRQWQVYVEAEGEYRDSADKLGSYYVRNRDGAWCPCRRSRRSRPASGPEFMMRYNLYRSAQINGAAAPGYSSNQAMAALEDVFAKTMPREMGFDYLGMSYQEKRAEEGIPPVAIFGLSLVFVFLILAALYESWSLPFSVLLGVPVAVFGAYLTLFARHMENNVFAQIGLIMLIGLSAKNAILIVEFARTRYEHGVPLLDAALQGAKVRLRPILMTSFAFIFGCVPLWLASGSGAVARKVMGTTVIGGMLAASGLAIFLIPVTFYVIEMWATKGLPHSARATALHPVAEHPEFRFGERRPDGKDH